MNVMKQKMLYAIIVIVIIAVILAGWYYFSYTGKMYWGGPICPRWKCTDIKTYTCFNGTTNYSCSNGVLSCQICTTNYTTKDYNVTLTTLANQTVNNSTVLTAIFTVNDETFGLSAGHVHTLPDETMFGVTTLYLNYSAFYLQAAEKKSSSLTAPFPASTKITLMVSAGGSCGGTSFSCPSGYTPSCPPLNLPQNTLSCTYPTSYICSQDKPFAGCTESGSCRFCPV
jgi:hypothetical protein